MFHTFLTYDFVNREHTDRTRETRRRPQRCERVSMPRRKT
jgi:hypothetical protein